MRLASNAARLPTTDYETDSGTPAFHRISQAHDLGIYAAMPGRSFPRGNSEALLSKGSKAHQFHSEVDEVHGKRQPRATIHKDQGPKGEWIETVSILCGWYQKC